MTKLSGEHILDAAAKVFRERGYGGATTREIASVAGILLGSLSYRYASKRDLLAAVAERGMARSLEAVREARAQTADPVDTIRRVFRTHVDLLNRADDAVYVLLYEWRALTGDARDSIVRQRNEYEALWDRMLREAAKAGALADGVDRRMLRMLFMSAANWSPQWFDSTKSGPEQVADELFELLWSAGQVSSQPAPSRVSKTTRESRVR